MTLKALLVGYALFGAGAGASGIRRALRRDPLLHFANDCMMLLLALAGLGIALALAG
jgi:hypothetical protein